METSDNTILQPFDYRIDDQLLFPKNNEINGLLMQQIKRNSKTRFLRKDQNTKDFMNSQVCLDKKQLQNEMIESKNQKRLAYQKGNSDQIKNDWHEKNWKWLVSLENKKLQRKEVDIIERQKEREKSIRKYEFENRMLICYYYFKYLIPLMVILVPLLLFICRRH